MSIRTAGAIIVCEGIRRARYRDSVTDPKLMAPGTPYEFTIDMWQTSQVFKAGHRIRVEVSSSTSRGSTQSQHGW